MGFSEESYFGRRPRFAGNDDIIGLMQSGTAQTVDTINRTGEQLARTYADIPRALGEGVRGTVESYKRAEKSAFEREMAEEDRARAKDAHEQLKTLTGLQIDAARRADDDAKREKAWWDEGFMAPGQAGPPAPVGLGMSRRQTKRDAELSDSLADIGRKGELFTLNKTQAEEAIRTAKAQRAAAAAAAAAAGKAQQWQETDRNEQRLLEDLTSAAGQDLSASMGPQPTTGPARPGDLSTSQIMAALSARGVSPERAQTLLAQARGTAGSNMRQQSTIDRNVEPQGAALQDRIVSLAQKAPQIATLVGDLGQLTSINSMDDISPEAMKSYNKLVVGLQQVDPATGAMLAKTIPGSWDVDAAGLFTSGRPLVRTRSDVATNAVREVISNLKQEAEAALGQALARGDVAGQHLANSATNVLNQLKFYEMSLGTGANPGGHNPAPPPRQFFSPQQQQQQQPQPPGQQVNRPGPRYDGRG